jgi:tRNA(His) 5'-end guanylyltransferase
MKDQLGDRMKKFYEDKTRFFLPRKTYAIIRVDGKAFHTYTKKLMHPFDDGLMDDMDDTACYLCKNIQGAKMTFVQSDEISILMTDFDNIETDMWFDGNIQKIVSVSASMATSKFNQLRWIRLIGIEDIAQIKLAEFDSRVFIIPNNSEVENYFIWRQQDTERNSISSVAQSIYSHKELIGKNCSEQQEMIFQKGINWNDYAPKYKRGRTITKQQYTVKTETAIRNHWKSGECPIFTKDREFLRQYIPKND